MRDRFRRYAQAHQLHWMIAGFALCTAVVIGFGTQDLSLPSARSEGWAPMAVTTLASFPFAMLAVGSMHSAMHTMEETATRVLATVESLHAAAAILLASLFMAAGSLIAGAPEDAAGGVRAVLVFACWA